MVCISKGGPTERFSRKPASETRLGTGSPMEIEKSTALFMMNVRRVL